MKKYITSLLMLALLCFIPMPTYAKSITDASGPLAYDPIYIFYSDDQTELIINGYFINAGSAAVTGVEKMKITAKSSDGQPVEADFANETLKKLSISVGTAVPFQFIMDGPPKGLDFSQFTVEYAIDGISVGSDQSLGGGKKIYFNGQRIQYDVPPTVISGRMMIPARLTFEKMGATVGWDANTQTVTVARQGITVQLKIGSSQMTVNGESVALEVPAQIINGRTLVPLRSIIENLESGVYYNGDTEMAVIYDIE